MLVPLTRALTFLFKGGRLLGFGLAEAFCQAGAWQQLVDTALRALRILKQFNHIPLNRMRLTLVKF